MDYEELEIETAFENGGEIPVKYTGAGQNVSPEFKIHNLAAETESLVIVLEDLSHPVKDFTHWIAWNIEAESVVPENAGTLDGVVQGIAYGYHKYAGPKPPAGRRHVYRFSIYSLDTRLNLKSNTIKSRLLKSIKGHILQKGTVTGWFER